jgi:hypothetical protein
MFALPQGFLCCLRIAKHKLTSLSFLTVCTGFDSGVYVCRFAFLLLHGRQVNEKKPRVDRAHIRRSIQKGKVLMHKDHAAISLEQDVPTA